MKIGVISDNHGTMNPGVYEVFADVELILHAGDIGSEDIITSLQSIAPVQAVYGNIDTFPLVSRYPETLSLEISGVTICVMHEFTGLTDPKLLAEIKKFGGRDLDILIYGHSHQAKLERVGQTYLFNPGSAGRKRFSLRPAVGLITIHPDGTHVPEIVYLD